MRGKRPSLVLLLAVALTSCYIYDDEEDERPSIDLPRITAFPQSQEIGSEGTPAVTWIGER